MDRVVQGMKYHESCKSERVVFRNFLRTLFPATSTDVAFMLRLLDLPLPLETFAC